MYTGRPNLLFHIMHCCLICGVTIVYNNIFQHLNAMLILHGTSWMQMDTRITAWLVRVRRNWVQNRKLTSQGKSRSSFQKRFYLCSMDVVWLWKSDTNQKTVFCQSWQQAQTPRTSSTTYTRTIREYGQSFTNDNHKRTIKCLYKNNLCWACNHLF